MKCVIHGELGLCRTMSNRSYRVTIDGQDVETIPDEIVAKLDKSLGKYVTVTIEFEEGKQDCEDIRKVFK